MFPAPREVDRYLYINEYQEPKIILVRFPAPREVDRFLYAPIRLRGREREAVQFPAPREGDR